MTVRIVTTTPPKSWRPGEIVVNPCAGWLGRDGRAVRVRPDVLRMMLALVSRPGAHVSRETLTELMWGERADGGPDNTFAALNHIWQEARPALIALGWAGECRQGFGYRVWNVKDDHAQRFTAKSECDTSWSRGPFHGSDDARVEADGRRRSVEMGLWPGAAAQGQTGRRADAEAVG
jgi:hypothetical protein